MTHGLLGIRDTLPGKWKSLSHVQLFAIPWTVACQALLCPWGLSRQEYWSGLPFPPLRDLPNLGMEPRSPALQEDSSPSEPPGKPTSAKSRNKEHKLWLCSQMIQGLVLQNLSSYNKCLNLNGSQQLISTVGIINSVLATSQRNSEYLTKGDF